ncbi:MAG: hypothetical protein VB039_09360 [Oscillospiraceae bacterium]|nr:hypothetical protein [Oscillospiraceae bacterium]
MSDLILAAVCAAMAVPGYLLMRRIDAFVEKDAQARRDEGGESESEDRAG